MAAASIFHIPMVHRLLLSVTMMLSICRSTTGFRSSFASHVSRQAPNKASLTSFFHGSSRRPSSSSPQDTETEPSQTDTETDESYVAPWTHPSVTERSETRKRNSNTRFRQHVNPLASKYQLPAELSDNWPASSFTDLSKPLHLDIGCGKGGFLVNMTAADDSYNYLGLEIRPVVAQYARERISIHGHTGSLDFVGCNANVDLDRILARYEKGASEHQGELQRVSIQYPDPHFKSRHAKRRVVTTELVHGLARFMPPSAIVFLQSDVQSVLDDMRERFRESPMYFCDTLESTTDYVEENILGVPTEREVSVLVKGLPVYRAVLTRTSEPYTESQTEGL